MAPTIHKERRERLEDKNNIIQRLNKRIEYLNQRIMALELAGKEGMAPLFVSVIEDKGSHLEQKIIIRQSLTARGYELLVC